MKCSDCHAEINEHICPRCGKNNSSQINVHQNKNDDVFEPEIVNDNDDWNRQRTYNKQEQAGNTFKSYTLINPNFTRNASCLPSFVSLFLTLLVLFQLGFLAALGFVFFVLVGKGISFVVIFKNLLRGKIIPPILLDSVVWIIAYSLVTWLAD